MPSDKDIVQEAREMLSFYKERGMGEPIMVRRLADEVKRLRRTLANAAIPYEALLLDSESRKWIAPSIWKEIESIVQAARAAIRPAKD